MNKTPTTAALLPLSNAENLTLSANLKKSIKDIGWIAANDHAVFIPANTPHIIGVRPSDQEIDMVRGAILSILIDVEAELVIPIIDKKRKDEPENYGKHYNKRMTETFNDKVKRYLAWLDRSPHKPANRVALAESLEYLRTIRNRLAHLPITIVIENQQPFLFITDGKEIYVFDSTFKECFETSMAAFLTEARRLRQHLGMTNHIMFSWLDAYNQRPKKLTTSA